MWSKKTIVALIVLALILVAGVSSVYAYQGHFAKKFSPEKIEAMKKAHQFVKEGNYEEARAIKEKLGLNMKHLKGKFFKGKAFHSPEKHEAVQAAIEAQDYSVWVEAVGEDCPMAQKITEDNFSQLLEVHKLKQTGDYKAATEIWQALDIKPKFHKKGHSMLGHK